jgi:hypothetical protein
VKWEGFLFLVACTSSQEHVTHVAIGSPTAGRAIEAEVGGATALETCDAFRSRMKMETAAALAKFPARYNGDVELHTLVGYCSPSWRLDMPEWASLDSREDIVFALEAKPTFVHTGARAVRWAMPETALANYGGREAKAPTAFDFDGDGDPEIFVAIDEAGPEGHVARQIAFLTFKGGAIAPYAPATSFDVDALEDVDGDGRPDLKIYAKYTDTLDACFSGFPFDHPPARFVAHALADGTFRADDDAAKRHAATWCPAPPSVIDDSAAAICARLWADDRHAVAREMKRVATSCVTGYCEREVKSQPQPPLSTEDCGRRQQWFEATPPFTF